MRLGKAIEATVLEVEWRNLAENQELDRKESNRIDARLFRKV